jgi:hypothetical protein
VYLLNLFNFLHNFFKTIFSPKFGALGDRLDGPPLVSSQLKEMFQDSGKVETSSTFYLT